MQGIDVSTLQGVIDWAKAAESGVEFAMIKATQGRGEGAATRHLRRFTDSKFKRNIVGATDAGISCGVYHYVTAQNEREAREEADYFCGIIEPYRERITLWAAADVESTMWLGKLSLADRTAMTREFLDRIEANGFRPMLYTNPDHIRYKFLAGAFDADEIWLASWTTQPLVKPPKLRIWQYGAVGTASDKASGTATLATGRISGIKAGCDVDHGYFDLPLGYRVGDTYTIRAGDVYTNGRAVPVRLIGEDFTISQVREGRILLREIASWVKV